jgi:hypothetical protein
MSDLNNLIEAHNEIDRLNNLLENEKREKNSFEVLKHYYYLPY